VSFKPSTSQQKMDDIQIMLENTNVVDALSDEVFQQLCTCLPGRCLLRFSAAAKPLHELATGTASIWRSLCHALLGEPMCKLHITIATRAAQSIDTTFWRTIFRQGQEMRCMRWSADLRKGFLGINEEGELNEDVKEAVVGSGHAVVGIGSLVIKVGGLRPQCPLDYLHTAIFDLESVTVHEVRLVDDSEKPERRLRHAACAIKPLVTGGEEAVLVLGGCSDQSKQPCKGGLHFLHVLELIDRQKCLGKWHSIWADGDAPESIWHHICGSFAGGEKVVVFGGDFKRDDFEFNHIEDRSLPAGLVYVLDVNGLSWERVATSGLAPTWRSLHAGFTHRDIASHSERLIILGGCAAHLPIFSSSDELAPMHGYALDLSTFQWQTQTNASATLPPARLRLASEKIGEWLVLYGGHGEQQGIGERVQLHKLNLRTLSWDSLQLLGREGSHPAAPAATMTAGLVLGGIKFSMFGVQVVAKLDVLTLDIQDDLGDEAEPATSPTEDSGDEESDSQVAVVARDAQGNERRMVVPRAMLAMLMARHENEIRQRARGENGGDINGDEEANRTEDPQDNGNDSEDRDPTRWLQQFAEAHDRSSARGENGDEEANRTEDPQYQ